MLTIGGRVIKYIARLAPINEHKYPHINVPATQPIHTTEPIHEASSIVIGPLSNGVESDISTEMAGDTHPIMHPYANMIKFANYR